MKKKILLLVTVFILMAFCIAGLIACGGDVPDKKPDNKTEVKSEFELMSFSDGKKITSSNNVFTVVYDPDRIDLRGIVCANEIKKGSAPAAIPTDELILTGAPNSYNVNETGYNISVGYKDYPAVSIKVIVTRATVARPVAKSDLVYDNGSFVSGFEMCNYGEWTVSEEKGFDGIEQNTAGSYKTKFVLNKNYKWATEVNGSDTADYIVNWSVARKKLPVVTIPDGNIFCNPVLPSDLSDKVEIKSSGETYGTPGDYDVEIALISENHCWNDGTTTNKTATYTVVFPTGMMNEVTAHQTEEITYVTNLSGNNPLNVSFTATCGENTDVYAELRDLSGAVLAVYKRIGGVWTLFEADGTTPKTALDASTYWATLTVPAGDGYPQGVSSPFMLSVAHAIIDDIPGVVIPTTIEPQVYTGEDLVADVLIGEYYSITQDHYTDAGTHYVMLTANKNYIFYNNGSLTGSILLEFVINPAGDNVINYLSVSNWEYNQGHDNPVGEAKYGEVVFVWSTSADPENWVELSTQYPTEIGQYNMKAYTLYSQNYNQASATTQFEITKIDLGNKGDRMRVSVWNDIDYVWAGTDIAAYPYGIKVTFDDTELWANSDFTVENGESQLPAVTVLKIVATDSDETIYKGVLSVEIPTITSLEETDSNVKIGIGRGSAITATINVDKNVTFVLFNTPEASAQENIYYDPEDVMLTYINGLEVDGSFDLFNITSGTLTFCGEGLLKINNSTPSTGKAVFRVNGENASLYINDAQNLKISANDNYVIVSENGSVDIDNTETQGTISMRSNKSIIRCNGGKVEMRSGNYYGVTNFVYVTAGEVDVYSYLNFFISSQYTPGNAINCYEITGGTLNIKNGSYDYARENYTIPITTAESRIEANAPGKVSGIIVVGKYDGCTNNDITLNIDDMVSFNLYYSDQASCVVWDITYGFNDYNFTFTGKYSQNSELIGRNAVVKNGNTITPCLDYSSVTQ